MYPYIQIILPSYGVLAFLGMLVTLTYVYLKIDSVGILFTDFLKITVQCVIAGWLGSKILFFLTQLPKLLHSFTITNMVTTFLHSGYVFYGGLLGVLAAVWHSTKKRPERRTAYFDLLAPAIPLFHFFGRIGCFLTGCCYGKKLTPPIVLLDVVILYQIPVQLIEAIFELFLFLVIFLCQKRKKHHLIELYLWCYALFRFIIEFFRADAIRGIYFGLSTAQWISLILLGCVLCRYLQRRFARKRAKAAQMGMGAAQQ